jgi:hypothetical protein
MPVLDRSPSTAPTGYGPRGSGSSPAAPATPSRRTLPIVAGIAYAASWVAGLLMSRWSTDLHSSGSRVIAALAGHEGAATASRAS